MLLADDNFRVIHVSTHVSLRQACDLCKTDRVLEVITLLNDACVKLGIDKPRIAVAGLNPHAGENGLFGDEEITEMMKEAHPSLLELDEEEQSEVYWGIWSDNIWDLVSEKQYEVYKSIKESLE